MAENKPKHVCLSISADELLANGIDEKNLGILLHLSEIQSVERKKRQAEGIAAAKARGVQLGRPAIEIPSHFKYYVGEWEKGKIPLAKILRKYRISEDTFYRRLREIRAERKKTNNGPA